MLEAEIMIPGVTVRTIFPVCQSWTCYGDCCLIGASSSAKVFERNPSQKRQFEKQLLELRAYPLRAH